MSRPWTYLDFAADAADQTTEAACACHHARDQHEAGSGHCSSVSPIFGHRCGCLGYEDCSDPKAVRRWSDALWANREGA